MTKLNGVMEKIIFSGAANLLGKGGFMHNFRFTQVSYCRPHKG